MPSKSKAELDLDRFPKRTKRAKRRPLYFEKITELDRLALVERGYTVVVLASLGRETVEEQAVYLNALLHGIQEGTIYASKERLTAIKLDMQSRGLLDKREVGVNISLSGKEFKELWNWDASRHTLRGNTTMVTPLQLEAALDAVAKGKVEKE